ncbi:hypothetical protein [Lentibacillus salicampi]|uniref:Ribbon-helix-helix protein, CopG family n=1 Tax=Lentibacillus salicampi TaxID=175306 RepID=A0A4Y9AB22_9BACI|nr:hypothetical protein [Lentibacillus salicampi]TFJ93108.1 hypothetical protein E4U82_08535 [Lentibacillus salicampi]
MHATKQRLHARLSPDTVEKIQTIADEKHVSQADAITKAIDHFYADRDEKYVVFKDMISDLMDEKLAAMQDKLHRIQVTGNVVDRDTKILLEFVNHYYLINEFKDLITTEKYKTNGMQQAEDLIQKRIHKHRQKKLDYEKRKEQKQQESEA